MFALSDPTWLLLTLETVLINTQRDRANTFKPRQADGRTDTVTHALPSAARDASKITATILPPFTISVEPKV